MCCYIFFNMQACRIISSCLSASGSHLVSVAEDEDSNLHLLSVGEIFYIHFAKLFYRYKDVCLAKVFIITKITRSVIVKRSVKK